MGWIVHFVPFRFSAIRTGALTCADSPTVVHAFGPVREVEWTLVSARAVVCGVACHVPFVLSTPTASERATGQMGGIWGSLAQRFG